MSSILIVALQIISFLATHREQLKQLVLDLEGLLTDGSTKAGAVKSFIGAALGVEGQLEAAWPIVAPVFNGFVAHVKKDVPAAVQTPAAA